MNHDQSPRPASHAHPLTAPHVDRPARPDGAQLAGPHDLHIGRSIHPAPGVSRSGPVHPADEPVATSPDPAPASRHDAHGGTHGRATAWSLDRLALAATIHCLTGCGIGEVAGMVIGTALGWGNGPTIALAVALAFTFGYALTLIPLRRAGVPWRSAARLAFAADTASIVTMEIVDNLVMIAIPGAMDASLGDALFWGSLALALALAAIAAWPINRWLIARGRGHAAVHAAHH